MAFSGTTEKCKACDKTVHFIDLLSADGISYHKTCFKCSHCNGLLVVCIITTNLWLCCLLFAFARISNFHRIAYMTVKAWWTFCYHEIEIGWIKKVYHQTCMIMHVGEVSFLFLLWIIKHWSLINLMSWSQFLFFLQMGSYCSMEGVLYCKPHFEQLFKETGSYTKKFQCENPFPYKNQFSPPGRTLILCSFLI